jgi:hypothetical protein
MPFIDKNHISKSAPGNLGEYDMFDEVAAVVGLNDYVDADNKAAKRATPKGYRSKFNPLYNVVFNDNDNRFITDEMFAKNRASVEPTIENLLREDNSIQQSYDLTDFLYCRDADLVSGYHMLTLRRFPYAVNDCINWPNAKAAQHDIGRLVTYSTTEANQFSSLMTMSFGLRWKELTADFWTPEVVGSPWGADGLVGQMFKLSNPGYLATKDAFQNSVNIDPHHDINKVYGPVDSIVSTHIRERGLSFDQSINLEFNYTLRSYDGVNGKAAFVDLLSHILACTFNDARFWGGANKWVGIPQSAHHKYMQVGTAKSMSGDFESNVNYYKSQFASLAGNNTVETIMNAAKMLLNGLGAFALDKIVKVLGRQSIVVANSLLSSEAVGNWHLTVGNPFRPVATIGNLLLMNTTITLGDELGHDGFPTSIKVTCELKHAKPRSRSEIEMMFNAGQSRSYFKPKSGNIQKHLSKSKAYRKKDRMTMDNLTDELYSLIESKVPKVQYSSIRDEDFFKLKAK